MYRRYLEYMTTMARWTMLILITTILLEVQPNFEPEESYCKISIDPFKMQQLNCSNASIHYFQNFKLHLNRTQRLICTECFLNSIEEDSFSLPPRHHINTVGLHKSRIRALRKFAFKNFPLLKILNLRNNSIDILEVDCFRSIKRLLQLDLSRNELQSLPNNLFQELENLDILNMNNNNIFSIRSDSFAGLSRLKYLYMNYNNLKRLEENIFWHLKELKILYLEHNMILDIDQNAFRNLKNLQFLYLNHNSIVYLIQYNFKPLASLVQLQLRYNNLSEIQTSTFNGLKNLKTLHLGKNLLKFIGPYGLVGLDQLEILDLAHNRLENINYFKDFSHLQNLQYLWLQNNLIHNIDFNFKYDIPNLLAVLDISSNQLISFNIPSFRKNLPKILDIFIENNSWNCQSIINLYNYLQKENITVCCSRNCSSNITENYIDDICNKQISSEEESDESDDLDFVTDGSKSYCISPVILYITLVVFVY